MDLHGKGPCSAGDVHRKVFLAVFYTILGAAAAAVLGPWLAPFLLAFLLAGALDPAVRFLGEKAGLPRRWAAALCSALLSAVLLGLGALLVRRLWLELSTLAEHLPALLSRLSRMGGGLEDLIYHLTVAAPPTARSLLTEMLDTAQEQLAGLAENFSGQFLDGCARAAAALPAVGLFLFTALLATFFISAGRPALLAFLWRQVPQRWQPRLQEISGRLKSALWGWLRAQAILMVLTFVLLGLGLLLMGVELAVLVAAGVALLDALPVFGTGMVLFPWAAIEAFGGNLRRAAALVALYGVIWLVRSLLEPKLVADRVGLHPLAALVAMYGGFTLFGVVGMILAPLGAVMLKQLHTCGVLRLWK